MSSSPIGTIIIFSGLLLVSVMVLVNPILFLRLIYGWGYFAQDKLGYRFTDKQTEFLKRLKESPETLKELDPRVFHLLELSGYIGIFMVTVFMCSIFGVFSTQ